jgi:hypothetical protein
MTTIPAILAYFTLFLKNASPRNSLGKTNACTRTAFFLILASVRGAGETVRMLTAQVDGIFGSRLNIISQLPS